MFRLYLYPFTIHATEPKMGRTSMPPNQRIFIPKPRELLPQTSIMLPGVVMSQMIIRKQASNINMKVFCVYVSKFLEYLLMYVYFLKGLRFRIKSLHDGPKRKARLGKAGLVVFNISFLEFLGCEDSKVLAHDDLITFQFIDLLYQVYLRSVFLGDLP